MPTKPLDRLMFAQGDLCFFCKQPLPKSEASVEHLLASANGGSNNDENCVACCKSVNALLGSMSLKEKFQVVLNQRGQFKCPNDTDSIKPAAGPKVAAMSPTKTLPKTTPKSVATPPMALKINDGKFAIVVSNLRQRGNSKPRNIKKLSSTVASLFPKGLSTAELDSLLQQLQATGKVIVQDDKVTYSL